MNLFGEKTLNELRWENVIFFHEEKYTIAQLKKEIKIANRDLQSLCDKREYEMDMEEYERLGREQEAVLAWRYACEDVIEHLS